MRCTPQESLQSGRDLKARPEDHEKRKDIARCQRRDTRMPGSAPADVVLFASLSMSFVDFESVTQRMQSGFWALVISRHAGIAVNPDAGERLNRVSGLDRDAGECRARGKASFLFSRHRDWRGRTEYGGQRAFPDDKAQRGG